MNTLQLKMMCVSALLALGLLGVATPLHAQEAISSSAASIETQTDTTSSEDHERRRYRWQRRTHDGNEVVTMGGNSHLLAGQQADTVVSIMGSSTSDGEVGNDVVSIMGNTRVTNSVGGSAVAVLGNTYVNSEVQGSVVAVLGNVELGPQADVHGEVVTIGGDLTRDAAARVRGKVKRVAMGAMGIKSVSFDWLRPWIDQCLFYGRPLAIGPGLAWAWVIALVSLLSYVLTAWLAPRPVERCVDVLERHAGASLLAALAGMVLSPLLLILLVVTVIGILAVPFVALALLCISMFGKLVMLAWLGRRVTRASSGTLLGHMAVVTLIGGAVITLLYLVPVLGFIVYKLLGFVGFGVVLYAMLLAFQQRARPTVATPNGTTVEADSAAPPHQPFASTMDADASIAEPASHDATLPRATFWIRVAALLIDALLITFVLGMLDIDHITLLVLAVYGALMWKYKGTTIGGLVFHLQVVRLDGRSLDWSTVVVRALSCFLSLLPAGLGFIWIAIDEGKQAWHDKIAGTVVVRTPKSGSLV